MKRFFKYFFISIGAVLLLFIINFFIIKKLDQKVLEMDNYYSLKKSEIKPTTVPSQFIDSARFYIKIPIINGDTILAFGDTGGGNSMIFSSTIDKKSLRSNLKTGIIKGIMPVKYISFRDLVSNDNFPVPYPMRNLNIRRPFTRVVEPYLVIPPMDNEIKLITGSMSEMDAFFGQNFFMGKAWTIDYINQSILMNTPLAESDTSNPNVQKIGFKKNNNHENIFGHPSMFIELDGEIIYVLFDTGASIFLSEEGKKELNTKEKSMAGSFIAASIFDKWRREHPEWKYFPKADLDQDLIEVPLIKIGNNSVGPVLFAKRPDENWSEGMIHSMDKVVKGAIGGSGLKYLKVTIDYNSELIKFEK